MENKGIKIGSLLSAFLVIFTGVLASLFLMYAQNNLFGEGDEGSSSSSVNSGDFPDFEPIVKSGSIILYQGLVIQETITPDVIRKNSRRIRINGELASGSTLVVKASTTTRGYDQYRKHTVYFYIDNGKTGGHLDATRKDGVIQVGGFTIAEGGKYNKTFELNKVPISYGMDGKTDLNVLNILKDNQPHWIGAFVATGIFGSLDEFRIDYICVQNTECSIEVL